jgi:hypothetical protein
MPHFFFELTDGITLVDPTGRECRDAVAARGVAVVIAKRVATVEDGLPNAPPRHISIRDSRGREVDRVTVRGRPIILNLK